VGAAAALKQLEKLRRESEKAAAELAKVEADLEACMAQQKVRMKVLPCDKIPAVPWCLSTPLCQSLRSLAEPGCLQGRSSLIRLPCLH
jgi:hypothetical protein